jgi:hypothetical protein
MNVPDNNAVYDEQIAPLLTQIIAICKEHKIPMAATFEYAPGDYCTTVIPQTGMSELMRDVNRSVLRTLTQQQPFQITTTKADGSKIVEVVLPCDRRHGTCCRPCRRFVRSGANADRGVRLHGLRADISAWFGLSLLCVTIVTEYR